MENLKIRLQVYAGGPKPMSFEDWSNLINSVTPHLETTGISLATDKKHFEQFPGSVIARDDDGSETDPVKRETNLMACLDYARQHSNCLCVFLATGTDESYGRGEFGCFYAWLVRRASAPLFTNSVIR